MVARKTSTLPTKIWSFAAKCPEESVEKRDAILSLIHSYTHKLIRIEEARLKEYRSTRKHYLPELETLEERLRDALASTASDKDEVVEEAKKQLRSAIAKFESEQCEAARKEYAERRAKACAGLGPSIKARLNNEILEEMLQEPEWPEAWKDLSMADRDAAEQVKAARADCNLTKGCYLAVENAVAAAIKDSRPVAPRFPKWDQSGRIAVQIEKNNRWSDILAGRNTFLRVTYADNRPLMKRGNGSIRCWRVSIRIGSTEDRSPVWLHFTSRIHRLLPDDAIVKWAWIKCYQTAGRPQHRFQITFEHESLRWMPQPGAVGSVDLECCHEVRDAGVCVARWCGSDKQSGEVVIPHKLLERFEHARRIRSALDKVRLHGYRVLRKWLALSGNHIIGWKKLGKDWMRAKLLDLCQQYVNHCEVRAPNDSYKELHEFKLGRGLPSQQRMALWLDSWLRKERHLWRYWRDAEKRAVNLRNEFFRREAHALRARYAVLSSDTAHLIPSPKMSETERSLRQVSAPGECRSIFRESFGLPRAPGSRGTSKAPKKRRRSSSRSKTAA